MLFLFAACDSAVSTLSADSTERLIEQISRKTAYTDSLLSIGSDRTDSMLKVMAVNDSLFRNRSQEYFDHLNLDSMIKANNKRQGSFSLDTLSKY